MVKNFHQLVRKNMMDLLIGLTIRMTLLMLKIQLLITTLTSIFLVPLVREELRLFGQMKRLTFWDQLMPMGI